MSQYEDIFAQLRAKDCLFEINGEPFLFAVMPDKFISLIQFKSGNVLHEESENHFAVFFSQVAEAVKHIPVSFADQNAILQLAKRRPEILNLGTLLSVGYQKEFTAISSGSIDKISKVHNLVNYLIPIYLRR
jgi:hypothetical protein